MRSIDLIVIHCAATREGQPFTAADIDRMHAARRFRFAPPNAAGLRHIGYHWFVRLDGSVEAGRPETMVGAHVTGFNARSIGICYAGGLGADGKPKDTRTPAQRLALEALVRRIRADRPKVRICGHRDLSPDIDRDGRVEPHEWLKACPSFDVTAWLAEIGLA